MSYVFVEYPKWVKGKDGKPIIVQNRAEESATTGTGVATQGDKNATNASASGGARPKAGKKTRDAQGAGSGMYVGGGAAPQPPVTTEASTQ